MDLLVHAFGFFQTAQRDSLPSPVSAEEPVEAPVTDRDTVLQKRKHLIGSKCQTFYEKSPLIVSRGSGQYLYDEGGREYLDCISNVQHVGHCHPHVVQRITEQMSLSNCNIRFVSPILNDCAEALLATLDSSLDTVLFVNSGSEANDLALRLARDFTGKKDLVVLDHAYHGHLISTMEMSPYKFSHGSSVPKPDWVHVAPVPDVYRGDYRLSDSDRNNEEKISEAGQNYSATVQQLVAKAPNGVAGFIAEALQSCGGQIIPPKGYMKDVAKHIRQQGGVMIIDEVQTGFGRVGESFWAHQMAEFDGMVPDILTIGKPIGNGFPVAAVITRKEIADRLGGNVGYFNTFGGNPVACAAILGVLEVLKKENRVEHCRRMGEEFKTELLKLKEKHQCIGDIRGTGLFWGIDLVESRETREPATDLALKLCLKLRTEYGVLLNADGPHSNILKYKPPMCFDSANLRGSVEAIDSALSALCSQ